MSFFKGRPNGKNVVATLALDFDCIFSIIAGNEDNHEIPDEFEIRLDLTMKLAALVCLGKSP